MRQKKKNVYHMGLVTRVGAEKSLSGVSDGRFRQHYPVPPEQIRVNFVSSVRMHHNSIYIAGKLYKREALKERAYYYRHGSLPPLLV